MSHDFEVGEEITVLVSVPDKTVGGLTSGEALLIHLKGAVIEVNREHVACTVEGLPALSLDGPRRGLWFPREQFLNADMHTPEVFLFDWIGVWEEGE